jgi:hypothetical protein
MTDDELLTASVAPEDAHFLETSGLLISRLDPCLLPLLSSTEPLRSHSFANKPAQGFLPAFESWKLAPREVL